MVYYKRNITDLIISRLSSERIIVVTGARQTGKTTLCEDIIPETLKIPCAYFTFDDPDERLRFKTAAISILENINTTLVVLDEVQKIPEIFDPIKYVVDKQKKKSHLQGNRFIITGSSQLLLIRKIKETLAGRASLFNLYPLSLNEICSAKEQLLTSIWRQKKITPSIYKASADLSAELMRQFMQKKQEHQKWGGYPEVLKRPTYEEKINWLKDYRKTYLQRDISDVGQVSDTDLFATAQKLICLRTAQILSMSEVARDLALSVNTIKRYISLLTATFQCYLLKPYYENTSKRLIKSPKIYFTDTGLMRVVAGEDAISIGAAYETWVLTELIKWKQLQPIEPEIYFYRTSGGLEIDFVLKNKDILLPIEVKASGKVNTVDGRNIELFMAEHLKTAPFGIIVYQGREIVEIKKNIWAIPDWMLFS
ncbi:MAG: ATP-binding protein [Thermodesulfovibrionales bacterium]|nr:ATP-binding protein [Thermodesulfovibrionales bacterium]